MKKKKEQTLFDDLYVRFLGSNPDAQTQDILRVAVPKVVTALQFKLVLRHPKWTESNCAEFREISIMRTSLRYVNVICTQGSFSDMVHAETMEQAMDAIYKYLPDPDFKRTELFKTAVVFALDYVRSICSTIRFVECADRLIYRDKTVNYSSEMHIQQVSPLNRVRIVLYIDGEQKFCYEPRNENDLMDKAQYVMFGGGAVEESLPELLRHELKTVTQMLEKRNVNLDAETITFKKEDFFSFVSDLLRHYNKGES